MTDDQREELLDTWELAAAGWGRQAESWAEALAPVSATMLEAAQLAPGRRVLELAAGPGELSLAAAPRVAPTKVLCSDGVQAMVDVARELAEEAGVSNIEFQRLALEWIDLPAASADVILCRFGLMLAVDPDAAAQECRRVLAPGGRCVIAVQGPPAENPWMTLPVQAAEALDLRASDPTAPGPGPFALAGDRQLAELLSDAGFFDVEVSAVPFAFHYVNERAWLGEKVDHSPSFAALWRTLEDPQRTALRERIGEMAGPHRQADGSLRVPGRALVAHADA